MGVPESAGARGSLTPVPIAPASVSPFTILAVALRLGLTSFGGPVAHIGYFRNEYVIRRRWFDEEEFADLVALSQALPGPASSELGIAVGIERGGLLGGFMAWLGFTLPSAVALTLFALVVRRGGAVDLSALHGLQLVAVAVVAQAVWQMGRRLTPDLPRIVLAVAAAAAVLASPTSWVQALVLLCGGFIGWRFFGSVETQARAPSSAPIGRRFGLAALLLLLALLIGLPLLRNIVVSQPLATFDSFYRAGALVFGGGHVVLPLLQASVVGPDWVSNQQFLTGYGAAQAVPGPLFTFAAYLGAVMRPHPNGIPGAALSLAAIFLPGFLLVIGVLPFWSSLRGNDLFRAALTGVNAAVVGLLLAALYRPIWTTAITSWMDVAVALVAFALIQLWKLPPWLAVLWCAGAGYVITR